ncbi:ArsR/SmtB family transcription factor [Ornithinicoccus hortensis]|uniref:ArsR family transcriptional regulator n=1 Tax=Ornithinicoccus hortensis TaxID=82346 RepID=A0A542YUJ5_9MICO|nr:metalloregulator ArsR/SmtB family transcription factor [Ornithinicoccus hortensis]TQL51758.1 ArsR family transcriptional regulator [Ornithinicoccus hortensis]
MTTSATTPELLTEALNGCCNPAGQPLTDQQAERVARIFKALGDPTRVKLYSLIAASASGEMCVCDLTGLVGLSQPTVSHHLKLLVDAGLVTREQRGRWAYFQPSPAPLGAAARALIGTWKPHRRPTRSAGA